MTRWGTENHHATHCATSPIPKALPASSPLPHFQGTKAKVSTFLPELGH